MLELVISATAVLVTLTGAGWILKAEWDRGRCAYLVFERTHAELVGQAPARSPVLISVQEDAEAVEGSATCGKAHEAVRLQKLEPERGSET